MKTLKYLIFAFLFNCIVIADGHCLLKSTIKGAVIGVVAGSIIKSSNKNNNSQNAENSNIFCSCRGNISVVYGEVLCTYREHGVSYKEVLAYVNNSNTNIITDNNSGLNSCNTTRYA